MERKVLEARKVAYDRSMPVLYGKLDLNMSSLKTAQCSLLEDSSKSYATFPEWGISVNGEVFSLRNLVSITEERGFMDLPTPIATDSFVLPGKVESYKKLFLNGSQEKLSYHLLLNGLTKTRILHVYELIMGYPKDWTKTE